MNATSQVVQKQLREMNLRLSESPDVEMRRALLQLIRQHGTTLPTGKRGIFLSNLARHAYKIRKKRLMRLVRSTDFQLGLDLTAHKEAVFLV